MYMRIFFNVNLFLSVLGVSKIFVLFLSAEGAQKARAAVHGRIFNGNKVEALFYPEELIQRKVNMHFISIYLQKLTGKNNTVLLLLLLLLIIFIQVYSIPPGFDPLDSNTWYPSNADDSSEDNEPLD